MRIFQRQSNTLKSFQVFVLILSVLFISPGIFDACQVYAMEQIPVTSSQTTISATDQQTVSDGDQPSSDVEQGQGDTASIAKGSTVTIDQKVPGLFADTLQAVQNVTNSTKIVINETAGAVKTDVTNLITGEQMSKLEKVLWGIGKAVIPTLAVIAFAATVACPVTWLVVGAIAVGAIAGGGMSYLADLRANNFKEDAKKKTSIDMVRDASIAAVTNAVAAPFTLVGGSLVAQAGKFTLTNLAKSAALQGATTFVSTAASKTAGGLTKKAWHKMYYKNDVKIAAKQTELNDLLKKYESGTGEISDADLEKMKTLQTDIDTLAKTDYEMKDWKKDIETGLVSGVIGGCLGGAATHLASQTKIAQVASQKLFQNTSQAGTLANLVVSNPFNYANGAAKAQISKNYITDDINKLVAQRDALPEDSPAREYYNGQIEAMQAKADGIDIWKQGKDAMINSLIINSASTGVTLAKAHLYDIPKAKQQAVDSDYQSQNPDWKKANDAKTAYIAKKGASPKKSDFKTTAEYNAAKTKYDSDLTTLKGSWKTLEKAAKITDKLPENQELVTNISQNYDKNKTIQQKIELARIYGPEAYKQARVDLVKDQGTVETWKDGKVSFVIRENGEIKKRIQLDPDDVQGSLNTKLGKMVDDTIKLEYAASAQAAQDTIDGMNQKLKDFDDLENGTGKLETWKDGTRHYVVRDQGKLVKNIKIDSKYKNWKSDPQVRAIEAQAYTVKPSTFKANYVKKELDDLKSQGLSTAEIKVRTSDIVKQADTAMVNNFGGSYFDCLKHEVFASQLGKAKFDGNYNVGSKTWDIIKAQPLQVRKKMLNEYIKTVNTGISDQFNDNIDTGNDYSDKFLETFMSKASNSILTTTASGVESALSTQINEF